MSVKLIDVFVLHLIRLANARINLQCFREERVQQTNRMQTTHEEQQSQNV